MALAGHTGSIAQLITAAAAGAYDGLPDGVEIIAGGCAFAKLAGAAYTGLPVGFVPVDAVPEHFGAVGDKITDDAVALQGWLTFLANSRRPATGLFAEFTGWLLGWLSQLSERTKITSKLQDCT